MNARDEHQGVSAEGARAILLERARLLARVPSQAPPAAELVHVLVFSLGKERYAIGTEYVCEVLRLGDFTCLPETPAHLIGITNVRGQILACFDLRPFLGVPAQEPTDASRLLVLGGDRPEFGVLADGVFEVVRLRTDEVLQPPAALAGSARDLVRGVTAQALIVLDGAKLFQDPRLVIHLGEGGPHEDTP